MPIRKKRLSGILISFIFATFTTVNLVDCSTPSTPNEFGAPYDFIAPVMWAEVPVISIHYPINGTLFNANVLNFSIQKPYGWYNNQRQDWDSDRGIEQALTLISYQIDNGTISTIRVNSNLNSALSYSINMQTLLDGTHSLKVTANATGVYRNSHNFWQTYPIDCASTVIFTVNSTAYSSQTHNQSTASTTANSLTNTLVLVSSMIVVAIIYLPFFIK
jgi:hypothetical protein